ncbi:MAG: dTDP-4-dehydrorhamnose reductase [Syntrophobacterales bacterium]|nr:dTDP-4-dehydrorhamnose reductase [Syntrophobacterales bacterium]
MIWLIGNKGMLGGEVEAALRLNKLACVATDQEVDIADPGELRRFAADKPIAWIINCAAYTAVDRAEDEPELAFKINAAGPRNIALIAKEKGAKFIHISTDYVFDGSKDGAYREDDVPNPAGVYGKSKYQGELDIAGNLDEHFIIRTAWLFGKQGNNFVHTMLRLFQERNEVRVVGDQWGSPTFAPDLAAALLEIVRVDSSAYGIYHFTNEGRINWHDFACEIYRLARANGLLDKDVRIEKIATTDYPTKAPRPQNSYLYKEKIARVFNIRPRSWQAALESKFRVSGLDI